jgi:hypothetical protein
MTERRCRTRTSRPGSAGGGKLGCQPGGRRAAQQVGREILTALEALDHRPAQARHAVDLTTMGEAFGVTLPDGTSAS